MVVPASLCCPETQPLGLGTEAVVGLATNMQSPSLLPSFAKKREDEEIEMDPGNKSDYRRVQINRKPSCQPPPTLGKARNNSACNDVVLKRFPAALLQPADRLYTAWLCCRWWITTCSKWHQFYVERPKRWMWGVRLYWKERAITAVS